MDLSTLWFILVAVLFAGFFFLEGFDFGVGILLPFMTKKDIERRMIINSIGPFWDGNEVWLITAGGAIFAAFPNWYATMFSGFYLALLLVIVALIIRGVAFEFRSKMDGQNWRRNWDLLLCVSSSLLAILWAVAMADLAKGVPIDKNMNFIGGFFDLLSFYSVAAGIIAFIVFAFHGAVFLTLRMEGELLEKSKATAKKLGVFAMIAAIILLALTYFQTDLYQNKLAMITGIIGVLLLISGWYSVTQNKSLQAMVLNGIAIVCSVASLFIGLFPRVMISSLDPTYSLTIYKASSSPYTLKIMTIVALCLVPVVLCYQAWTYWIFKKRVTQKDVEY